MKLKDMIEFPYQERGERITQGRELYWDRGSIKVISSATNGPMGYYSKYNYQLKDNSFVYSIEGSNAGYVSIYKPQKIWLMDVAGVVNIKDEYIQTYGKETVALFLQGYFVKNRHNNGTQPKFTLKRCLDMDIDINILKQIKSVDLSRIARDAQLMEHIYKNYGQMEHHEKRYVLLRDILESYRERGTRLVVGRDLYQNRGGIPVISSTTTGPMGYYNKYNYELCERDIVYAIDGANAGYTSFYGEKEIWLTDHAGVIRIKRELTEKYSMISLAVFLQNIFTKNLLNTGTQPMFTIKSILDLSIDTGYLEPLENLLFPAPKTK